MNSPIFLSSMAPFLNQFVQYKRALNRKYCADAEVLRLFDRYIQSRQITGWSAINSLVNRRFSEISPTPRECAQLQPSSWNRSSFLQIRRHAAMDRTEPCYCLSSP